jgi:ribose transport system permease protein
MEEPGMRATINLAPGNLSPAAMAVVSRVVAVGLVTAVLTWLSDGFLTTGNLLSVLRQASLLFLLASGLTLVILAGGLDLSVGANLGLCACLAAAAIKATGSPMLGAAVGVVTGSAVGVANGLLVTTLRLPAFIATYGMLWIVHGLTYAFMAGETIHGFPAGFRYIGAGFLAGIPVPVLVMAGTLVAGTVLLQLTVFGQELYAIGANPVAAALSGVPVKRRHIVVYAVSGAMAGLASLVFLARMNAAEGDIGEPMLLPAIAAVLGGGAALSGGRGYLVGTMVGALLLTLVLNGMNLLSVSADWQPIVTGAIVLGSVLLERLTTPRGA